MSAIAGTLAAGSLAASGSSSLSGSPFFILIIVGLVLFSSFIKAASRKKRANQAQPYNQQMPARHAGNGAPSGRAGVAHQNPSAPAGAPFQGTMLNGVPLRNYDTAHGHQTMGFANERMRAEAELKRQLDALDAARRGGQVTAEQYAAHREAIFKNF